MLEVTAVDKYVDTAHGAKVRLVFKIADGKMTISKIFMARKIETKNKASNEFELCCRKITQEKQYRKLDRIGNLEQNSPADLIMIESAKGQHIVNFING